MLALKLPKFKVLNEPCGQRLAVSGDDTPEQLQATLSSLSGTPDMDLAINLLNTLAQLISPERTDWTFNQAASLIHALSPQNPQEALLVTQMAATHQMALHLMAKAGSANAPTHVAEIWLARAAKLMNLYARQVEVLDKLRNGNQSFQKVVVERVEVKAGGQAIVGAFNPRRGQGS